MSSRDGRKTGDEGTELGEEMASGPLGESSGSTDRPKERKVKVTYSLPVSLARLIDTVAGELGIPPCELVATLMGPSLKGCRRPTIPKELRGLFPQRGKSAA